MKRFYFSLIAAVALCFQLQAIQGGKIGAGALATQIEIIQSGQKIDSLYLYGGRIDATIVPFDRTGFCVKSFFSGALGDGDFYSVGCALGHYTPLHRCLAILPSLGYSHSHLSATIQEPLFGRLKETFRSDALYLGLDFIWKPHPKWALTAMYQYGWADTRTKLEGLGSFKGESKGSNSALMIDYFFAAGWSATAAVGYNNSLSKERHGLEAKGVMLGVSRCF